MKLGSYCPCCGGSPDLAWMSERKWGHVCPAFGYMFYWAKFGVIIHYATDPDKIKGEVRV